MIFRHSDSLKSRTHLRMPVAVLLSFIGMSLFSASAHAGTAEDDYRNAYTLYKKGRWQLAANALGKYVSDHGKKKSPQLPFARLYWGISLENAEKYSEARKVLRKFVVDYPKNANTNDVLYRIAECSFFLDELKVAETDFLTFIKKAPKHDFTEYAFPYLGDVQFRLNKTKAAEANFRKSLAQFKNGRMAGVSKLGLSRCLKLQKKPNEAITLLQELTRDPAGEQALDAQNELATLYFGIGRYRDAAKAFDEIPVKFTKKATAEQKSKLTARAKLDAGFSYFRATDYKLAAERFTAASVDKTFSSEANYWRGLSYKELADYKRAIPLLKAEFQRDEKGPLADAVLFAWAACERLNGQHDESRKLYLDFVKRWPQKPNADDSLHYAGEMAFLANRLNDAQSDISRFKKEYDKSPLWPSQMILQGRVHFARGGKKDLPAAVEQFRKVIAESQQPGTQLLARFYLAQTYRLQQNHQQALAILAPLLKSVAEKGNRSRYVNALILAGRSSLSQKQNDKAIAFSSDYLKLQPQGELQATALTTRMTAYSRLNQKTETRTDLATLAKQHANNAQVHTAVHEICEAAYSAKDWKWSAELFGQLEKLTKNKPLHPAALSGLAWSQFELKDFLSSAKTFARIVKEHPGEKTLVTQAAYKHGESLANGGKTVEAATAYEKAFQDFAPTKPAAEGTEVQGKPLYYVYHSGLAAARAFAKLKKTKAADAAYEKLFAKFPKPAGLDRRLDEWALLNYNAGNYKRSDEIFRRIIRETPNSDLVDNARYSLAESSLNAGKLNEAKKEFISLHADKNSDATVKEISLYRLIGIGIEQNDWKPVRDWADRFYTEFTTSEYRPYARFTSAEARVRLNDFKPAREILIELQKLPATSSVTKKEWFPRVWILQAEISFRLREYNTIIKTVAELRTRFPKFKRIYEADEVLGRCYQKQALFEKSREAFGRVVSHPQGKTTQTAAKSQFMIGETYLMQDKYKKARDAFLRVDALFEFPVWQAPALFQAGRCEEALKEWKGAKKSYTELIKKFATSTYAIQAKPYLKRVEKQLEAAKTL
jgi:cellulose synthase operon protein C